MDKSSIKKWLGPDAIKIFQNLSSIVFSPRLRYAPKKWETKLPQEKKDGWDDRSLVEYKIQKWNDIQKICNSTLPLGFSYENDNFNDLRNVSFHNIHITFGYVVAMASRMKNNLKVLDWGGGLGHYCLIANALLPEVELEYHCVEVPNMAKLASEVNKKVTWFSDNSYLSNKYDLVMVNASLQYVREWKQFMFDIASITNGYFFLTRIPVVERSEEFLAIQKEGAATMLHIQFNEKELLDNVASAGFTLLREFVVGDKPFVKSAPEQCELRGWLFKKNN
jgi:putative methyltransferase (TIGR04325 family)